MTNHKIQPHFDGKRFAYPDNSQKGSRWDVLRWAITRKPAKWPRKLPNPEPDPIHQSVGDKQLRITFINHATVLIQSDELNIITDPVFSKRVSPVSFAGPRRHRNPGLNIDQLPPIHAVLISHTHYDHMDLPSIDAISRRDQPVIVAPLNNGVIIEKATDQKAVELTWWSQHAVNEQTQVHLVPARHWTSRKPGDENQALWGGFVICFPSGNVFFAGDTGYGDGSHFTQASETFGTFRCALLPIGGYEPRWFMQSQHMNPDEAVLAFKKLKANYALGIHHGTFQLTDEAHDAPLLELQQALKEHAIDPDIFRTLDNGGAWNIP
ncbi:MAG: MBL fold metallo-hydrolase [Granulosicoccus sp.]|nr:MBL fold metallo-hydrolase [Granulosicoccus sp.]